LRRKNIAMRANLNKSAVMVALLLVTAGTAFAVPLIPLGVGVRFVYGMSDDAPSTWVLTVECVDQVTYGSLDYYDAWRYNYEGHGDSEQLYLRSTDVAVYRYNPSVGDILMWQIADVGTEWYVYEPHEEYCYEVTKITAIEPLSGPWGTGLAYEHHKYRCVDLSPMSARSPERDEWVVPGKGLVKVVDDWAEYPPEHQDLVSITTVTVDITADTITARTKSVTCNITLSYGPDVAQIIPESIQLQGTISATRTHVRGKPPMLIATFPISELGLTPGPHTLTVTGALTDGSVFAGKDVVTVVTKGGP
jgi:hypothetical protein